jgi:hypothetical protein
MAGAGEMSKVKRQMSKEIQKSRLHEDAPTLDFNRRFDSLVPV